MIFYHYNLFISSTFKDMDVERDIIKFEVIPALNGLFNRRGVEIQAIDLRYGVNTSGMSEAEASDKVLNMCVQSIDRARPFFVGFIGNRYGWVPPQERWLDFYRQLSSDQQGLLADSAGLSVTEMEILYSGLFADNNESYRAVFCLRDGDSQDGSDGATAKVQALRTKIEQRCAQDDRCRQLHYRMEEDDEQTLRAPGLAQQLVEALAAQIDSELAEESSATSGRAPLWATEINETRMRMVNLAERAVHRPSIERRIEEEDSSVIISGPSFSGKSTVLATMYYKYLEEDWQKAPTEPRKILLTAQVNCSRFSRNIHQLMGRWVIEMAMVLGLEQEEEMRYALIEAAEANRPGIRQLFYQEVDVLRAMGHSVHIFIDDLDQFLWSSPGDEQLQWLDERVRVYATVNSNSLHAPTITGLPYPILIIPERVDDPHHALLETMKVLNFCELPESVCQRLAGDEFTQLLEHYNDRPDYICSHLSATEYTFLQLNTMFKMARLLSKEDFRKMRQADTLESSNIMDMFAALPQDYDELLDHFLTFFTDRVGNKQMYIDLIQLLREHPSGLSVGQIIDAMGGRISAPDIYNMLYYFDDFITIEYDTQIVKIRHRSGNS